jgi:hypothetical protein
VLASIGGLDRFGQVLIITSRDVDGIDVTSEELIKVGGLTLDTAVSPVSEPTWFVVVEATYPNPKGGEGRQHPGHGDIAGPDQADGERPGRGTSSRVDAGLSGVGHFTDPAVSPPMK